ncbi:MAG: 50S ribosomal protein L23 [Acidobacteria bacterium]|nr:50S ribosomal protein L23 [Acidobacteriota bacterium]
MNLHKIIIRPIVTEKSVLAKETRNVIAFEVARSANKIEVKKAVEKLFEVKVDDVRLLNVRGKVKRLGRNVGRRPNWRKAYVRLAEGERAPEFFEGV